MIPVIILLVIIVLSLLNEIRTLEKEITNLRKRPLYIPPLKIQTYNLERLKTNCLVSKQRELDVKDQLANLLFKQIKEHIIYESEDLGNILDVTASIYIGRKE